MPITLPQILRAPVVTRAISRIRVPQMVFQRFLGVLPGGPNVDSIGGQDGGWDIMDHVRDIATGRDRESGPATVALTKIGHVSATMWRAHEKKSLAESRLFRTRPLGGPWGSTEIRGERYVTRQERTLAQRIYNAREFIISRMFRGLFYMRQVGDNFVLTDTSGSASATVNYQVPAGNLDECAMDDLDGNALIPTTLHASQELFDNGTAASKWETVATAPILDQMHILNSAFEVQHGMPLRHVFLNSDTWVWVLTNTDLRNAAGTANTVWSDYRVAPGYADPGRPDNIRGNTAFEIVMRALPWLTWHIYDGVLRVDGSNAKFIPANKAIFLPDPSPEWFELQEGSELVRENLASQSREQFGIHAWVEPQTQPAGFELIVVDNCLPALYIPRAVVYGTVNY